MSIKEYIKSCEENISWNNEFKQLSINEEIASKEAINTFICDVKVNCGCKSVSDKDVLKAIQNALKDIEKENDLSTWRDSMKQRMEAEPWMKGLDFYEKSEQIKDSSINNMRIFEKHPTFVGKLYYDIAQGSEMYDGDFLTEDTLATIKSELEKITKDNRSASNVKSAVIAYCADHKRNPLKENLIALRNEWDGTPRLEEFFIKAYECDDTPYIRYATKVLFYAWVNRILRPGCAFDSMFVFEGPQGIGKSKLLPGMIKMIGGRACESMKFDSNDRNNLEKFSGWQLCISEELKDIKKADLATIKDLISRSADTFDKKFRSARTYDRSCILVGNVNPEEKHFLKDLNEYERRFIIFPCHAEGFPNGIRANDWWWDENFPKEYKMQVWAEAVYLVEHEPNFRWISLPGEIAQELKKIQASYKFMIEDDVFIEKLWGTLDLSLPQRSYDKNEYNKFLRDVNDAQNNNFTTENKQLEEIDCGLFRRYVKDMLKEDRSKGHFDVCMKHLGWESKHTTTIINGKRTNVYKYVRIQNEEQIKLPF